MKRLIILFLFFSTAFAQTKDTLPVQLNYGGVTITGTLIIPHQQGNGNVTKSQLDSGLANKALQVPTQIAINAKQDKLIQGNNIQINGNTISATGGGGTVTAPLDLSIAPINNFQTFTPFNYLQKYPTSSRPGITQTTAYRWEYSYRSDVSLETMPDNVYNLSYNVNPQGSRYGSDDAGIRFGYETNYLINGVPHFEIHHPEVIDLSGIMHRIDSKYISKLNGKTFEISQIDDHNYLSVLQGSSVGQIYLNIHSNVGGSGTGLGGIGGGIDFYADGTSNRPGTITYRQSLYPASSIHGSGGGVSIQTNGEDNVRFWVNSKGNTFINYSSDNLGEGGSTLIGNTATGDDRGINPHAKLQVESKTKGVLLVRMTSAQRTAIQLTTDDEGLEVYDITLHAKMFWNGTAWKTLVTQ